MAKFKKKLVEDIKKEQEEEKRQKALREQYEIEQKDVVVVEKNNMVKFTVSTVTALVRLCATIVILCLATIGLLSLLYPNVRTELMVVLQEYMKFLKVYLPFL